MTDDRRANIALLARLRDEIRADRTAIARCLLDVGHVLAGWRESPPARAEMVLAAAALHAWYTGLEATLERVGRALDRSVPAGEGWHRELLSQAMTVMPSIRPAVLPRALEADLIELLAFRHFFRHGYGLELDPTRLRRNLDRLQAVAPAVDTALDELDRFLAGAIEALAKRE